MLTRLLDRLHRFAEAVAATLMAVIFIAFIVQIAMRYVFDNPVGWTTEVSLAAWLWLVLWGAAFVLRDDEEIRIDLLSQHIGPRATRALTAIGAVSVIVLFGMALPASYAYVSFMKVETSAYLGVRMDWMYAIYLVFAVAVIARGLRTLVRMARGTDAPRPDTPKPSSAL